MPSFSFISQKLCLLCQKTPTNTFIKSVEDIQLLFYRCQNYTNICDGKCKNGGTCIHFGSVRHKCVCAEGYTGIDCETLIGKGVSKKFYMSFHNRPHL